MSEKSTTNVRVASSRAAEAAHDATESRGGATVAFAIGAVTIVLWICSVWITNNVLQNGFVPKYIIPLLKQHLRLASKDVPPFALLAAALIAFVFSPFIATVLKAASPVGYDNMEPRSQKHKYSGITARAIAAHENAVEAVVLLGAAIIISQQAGVAQALRSSLSAFALICRVLYQLLYLVGFDFARSLVWMCFTTSCMALLAASAIPGFSKNLIF